MRSYLIAACLLALTLMALPVFAVIPFDINYQGHLTNPSTGDPVPNDIYSAEFRFYADSTGGTPEITKTMNINTNNGYFRSLIEMEPLEINPFSDRLFLEVVIGGEVMSPRMPLSVVPYSGISQRVLGDIQTGPGSLNLMEPLEAVAAMEMTADVNGNEFKINWMEPLDSPAPAFDFKANSEGGRLTLNYMEPLDLPAVHIAAENIGGIGNIASMVMFNPQPEPPAEPLLEMNTTQYGANFAMTAPQASGGLNITDPMLQMYTTEDGAGFNLSDEIGKYMGFEPTPFTPGGYLYLFDPSVDDTNITLGSDGTIKAVNGLYGYGIDNTGNVNFATGTNHNLTGSYSFAGGYSAQVFHNNCFVWSDYYPDFPLPTTANNQFKVRSSGGTWFYSNSTMNTGVTLAQGSSSWNAIIPALTSANSRNVDGEDILNKIKQLRMKRYINNSGPKSSEHVMPETREFNRLFNTGNDDNQISPLDQSGVALAGIQELMNIIEQQNARIGQLEKEIAEIRADKN